MSRQFKNGKCSCWNRVEKELGKSGSGLDFAFTFDGKTHLKVATIGKGIVLCSYCPFCGEKLKGRGGSE